MDLETLQAQLQKAQEEIAQKEAKVAKLKGLLTRSMRSDKRREQQIGTLQIDLEDKEHHVESLNQEIEEKTQFSARQAERINQLEAELTELTARLQSGVGSEAAQKRNERMKQMLERSNVLYGELQTKYQKVCRELEQEKQRRTKTPNPQKVIILSDEDSVTLNDDGTYEMGPTLDSHPKGATVIDTRKRSESKAKESKDVSQSLLKVYLRGVLLEFFIGEASTQMHLIPVILQLLDCTPEQIQAAQRSYAEGRQIIAKATSAFGL